MDKKETTEIKAPNFEGEKMKMPENTVTKKVTTEEYNVVSSPLLLILTVLLVLILGGMYFWFKSITAEVEAPTPAPIVERPTIEENNEPESTTAEAQVETAQAISTSDEIDAIVADLEATDLENLDKELEAIDAELEAALNSI